MTSGFHFIRRSIIKSIAAARVPSSQQTPAGKRVVAQLTTAFSPFFIIILKDSSYAIGIPAHWRVKIVPV
jgi:hypothetical protein